MSHKESSRRDSCLVATRPSAGYNRIRHQSTTRPRGAMKGRLGVVRSLQGGETPSISIGSSASRMADINVDVDASSEPDVIADALHLPFVPGIFREALFTDVIEHLPDGMEVIALQEIHRILSSGGRLIVSTPNDLPLYSVLDLSRWLEGHRHYSVTRIEALIRKADFRIDTTFTSGGIFTMISVLRYCLVSLPLKRLFGERNLQPPKRLSSREDRDYGDRKSRGGYTVFCSATRI
jgi:SAM-dependent methyltransferase